MVVEDAGAQSSIVVPGGNFLQTADFVRQNGDLVLIGADGRTVVLRGYFSSGRAPDLISDSGAHIPGALAVQLAGPMAPGQYAQAGPAEAIATAPDGVGSDRPPLSGPV